MLSPTYSLIPSLPFNFSPTKERDDRGGQGRFDAAAPVQEAAIAVWTAELERRFPADLRARAIVDVPLRGRP